MVVFQKKEKNSFPELPKPEFPNYESQINVREKIPPLVKNSEEDNSYKRSIPTRRVDIIGDKPLFIKMDKYKEAINDLENAKKRIKEAEHIFNELERIRAEEDQEIENWKIEMEKIKMQLLEIDKKLFEEAQNG